MMGGDIRGFSVASGVGWAASGGKEMRGQEGKSGNTPELITKTYAYITAFITTENRGEHPRGKKKIYSVYGATMTGTQTKNGIHRNGGEFYTDNEITNWQHVA